MPHIDRKTGEIVMRVVYDGAPEAGKTTNIFKLCEAVALQRRGELKSPGTEGRRTEYFDWLDFAGGYVDGRKVRCQIVSVPGQSQLLHRRRYLLNTADAVVFVADSRPDQIAPNLDSLATTLRVVESLSEEAEVGIVLQANKQDLEGALTPRALAEAFQLPASGFVLGARAHCGEGVMQTFIMAVRLATDRIRSLALGGLLLEGEWTEQDNPEALYADMLQREPSTDPAPPPVRQSILATDEEEQPWRLESIAPRLNPARREPPELPMIAELGAGHIWPPSTGRGLLASLGLEACSAQQELSIWAPPDALELTTGSGSSLLSQAGWAFRTEHEARLALVGLVRTQLKVLPLLPEGRVLFMAKDGLGFRLWVVTPRLPTLREAVSRALRERSVELLAEALKGAHQIATGVQELSEESDRDLVSDELVAFGCSPAGRWSLLSVPQPPLAARGIFLGRLLAPLMEAMQRKPGLQRACLEALQTLPTQLVPSFQFIKESVAK